MVICESLKYVLGTYILFAWDIPAGLLRNTLSPDCPAIFPQRFFCLVPKVENKTVCYFDPLGYTLLHVAMLSSTPKLLNPVSDKITPRYFFAQAQLDPPRITLYHAEIQRTLHIFSGLWLPIKSSR